MKMRETKLFNSQIGGGVNKMYGIFRCSHPRTTHAAVTTNLLRIFTPLQIYIFSRSSLFKIYIIPYGFVCSDVVSVSLLALSEFKTKRT
jgi:hypothetical protein